MRLLYLLLFTLGCTSNSENIQGHWHSITHDFNVTLDISDSIVICNMYNRSGGYDKCNLMLVNGQYYMFNHDLFNTARLELKSDTLITTTVDSYDSTIVKWIRVKPDITCFVEEFRTNLIVDVTLSEDISSMHIDSIIQNRNYSIIDIGYPNIQFDNYRKDKLTIQINDAYAKIDEVEDYLQIEHETYSENNCWTLIINADKKTPIKMLDSIINSVKIAGVNVDYYRTYTNLNGFIGVKKIKVANKSYRE